MFYKEILEQTGPGGAFLEHVEAQFLKSFSLAPIIVTLSRVQWMYLSAQKYSGYVTAGF